MVDRLRSILPIAGSVLLLAVLLVWVPLLAGCGPGAAGTGACYGWDSDYDECYEGFKQSACDQFDSTGTNGHSWSFAAGQSCPDVGFSVYCPSYGGYYGDSADDCF